MQTTAPLFPAMSERYSATEWAMRCDLAALYRISGQFGMTDLVYTHISARIPGTNEFLINPFGTLFQHMTASELVRIDSDGNITDPHAPKGRRVNKAGFVIHSAVHGARENVLCVIHSHTIAGMAVSAQKQGLLPLTQHAMMFHGRVGYHDYESFAVNTDERVRIARDLGDNDVLVLRNHGTLVTGRSIAEAFHSVMHFDRACEAQVMALAGGVALSSPSLEAAERTAEMARSVSDDHLDFVWRSSLKGLTCDADAYCC